MPNWCSNQLTVTGPEPDLNNLQREVQGKDSDLDFEMILPTPRKLLQQGEGWYDWRIANWGTKWEVEARRERISPQQIDYHFDSAWSPPCSIVEALGANFPSLSFSLSYNEPGCCFIGNFEIKKGRITVNHCREMTQKEMDEIYGC